MTNEYQQLIGLQEPTFCACGRVASNPNDTICETCEAGLLAWAKRESEAVSQNYYLGRVA